MRNVKSAGMGSGEGSAKTNFIVSIVHLIINRLTKSRKLRWVGHVVRIEEGRGAFRK